MMFIMIDFNYIVLLGGGIGGLKAIYCNDKFLVIHSTGAPNHKDGLKYIPQPPGEAGVPYSQVAFYYKWLMFLHIYLYILLLAYNLSIYLSICPFIDCDYYPLF